LLRDSSSSPPGRRAHFEERSLILSMVDILEPGDMFYGPEDQTEKLFILQKGKIRIFRMTPEGQIRVDLRANP
jgi:hypothetical protein